jgi:tetratricopeptide (TPR) repeat protein
MSALAMFSGSARAREVAGPDADITLAESKADQAFQAYQSKRFAEAVALYMEAYNAAPNADILYNVARIYDAKLLDRPLAINFYRRYITDPGAVADRIQIANERLLALREAELAATQPTREAETTVAAAAIDTRRASVSAPPGPGWSTAEVLGVALASTGVVALGVGTGFGVAAMGETNTVNDLCQDNVCSEQRGIDTAQRARDHATISTIGFASGGALLALGAVLYFWVGGEESAPLAPEPSPSLGARVTELPGGLALELGGSW